MTETLHLTAREKEVLCGFAAGLTNREIAKNLYVSKRTVDFHAQNAYRKMGVRNRIEALNVMNKGNEKLRVQAMRAIVDASVKMHRFNQESRKLLTTAAAHTEAGNPVYDRIAQERQNYLEWEAAVEAWEAEYGRDN